MALVATYVSCTLLRLRTCVTEAGSRLQVYSGGIGSYALLVMVAAFLLLHPSRADAEVGADGAAQLEGNLGVLLLDFLRLFGRSLNVMDVGVSCRCLALAEPALMTKVTVTTPFQLL